MKEAEHRPERGEAIQRERGNERITQFCSCPAFILSSMAEGSEALKNTQLKVKAFEKMVTYQRHTKYNCN